MSRKKVLCKLQRANFPYLGGNRHFSCRLSAAPETAVYRNILSGDIRRLFGHQKAYRIRHILQERGSRIRIESSPEVSVEIDGEPLGHTPLEFSILHRAIRIVVARDFYQRCAAVGAETPAG